MESATWCRTPAAASAARRLRPEVSKNSNTALASNEGELARSITTCVPAMAPLRPSPVMVLTPVLGEAATTSWPPWRRMATVLEPIRPVPPITTIFIANLLVRSPQAGVCDGCAASRRSERTDKPSSVTSPPHEPLHALVGVDLGIQPSTTPSRRRGAEVEEDVPPSRSLASESASSGSRRHAMAMARLRSPPGSAAPGLYYADTPTRGTLATPRLRSMSASTSASTPTTVRTVRAGPCARPAGSVLHRGRGSVPAFRALRRHGPDGDRPLRDLLEVLRGRAR